MPTPSVKGEDGDENQQTNDDDELDEEEVEEEVESEEGEETPEDDEDEPDVEEAELPDEDDEDDEESSGSLLSGSTFGVSNKWLLGIGIAAILLVLLLRSLDANSSTRTYDGDEQVEEEVEEGSDGAVEKEVTDAGGSAVKYDQQSQDDAIGEVFG